MEALLFDLRVPAPSETALLNASGLEDYLHQHTLSADDLRDHLRLFERHCERLDQTLTQEQEEKHFARFCSLIQESLLNAGSFSECSLDEADFTLHGGREPSHVLRVRSGVPVSPELAVSTISACLIMKSDYAVIFDSRHGRSVLFGNGDFVLEED
ncbi:hypothetical protein [Prosthecobacter vanneervenii]|uniref:Uncharacterized protein n=1 Tax=Prosthecobacter vanneervenii TaxID=48466 RepID=A0A7W7Y910_9BACT|nr:hypothetical protein [Prosthecobacter vanneervenii]MBB5031837.1 hypothetical protein [Prosthecobacter vanneervenii]